MKAKLNGLYKAKVNGKLTTVRVDDIAPSGRLEVTNLKTGRRTYFNTSRKLRSEVSEREHAAELRLWGRLSELASGVNRAQDLAPPTLSDDEVNELSSKLIHCISLPYAVADLPRVRELLTAAGFEESSIGGGTADFEREGQLPDGHVRELAIKLGSAVFAEESSPFSLGVYDPTEDEAEARQAELEEMHELPPGTDSLP